MGLKVTFLGSATFVLEDSTGNVAFIDPWLDAEPGNPGCPIRVADVARADLVLLTHGDPAHYGRGDSVRVAAVTGCPFASNPPVCQYVVSKGLLPERQVLPLTLNVRHKLGFLDVTVFPVIHPDDWEPPPGYEIPREPNTGFTLFMGGVSVLYTGDTVLGDEVYRGIAAQYAPVLGLLPVASPAAGHGTLEESAEVAASVARMIDAKCVIPHYRYVPDNPAVGMLVDELRPAGVQVVRLAPGQSFSLS